MTEAIIILGKAIFKKTNEKTVTTKIKTDANKNTFKLKRFFLKIFFDRQ